MRLHRLQDIQFSGHEEVFKESSLRRFLLALFLGSLTIGVFHLYQRFDMPMIFVYLFSGIIGVWALLEFHTFFRTFSPENWLLRIGPDKIVIKFRSFMNRHLPDTDKQAVTIPLKEIKEVREVKETIKTFAKYGYSSKTRFRFFTELEIVLSSVDTKELEERLRYEVNVRANTKHHHYPVSLVNGDRIKIEWNSAYTGVSPRIGRALKLFASHGVKVASQIKEVKDYRETANVDKAEMETRIVDLIQRGDVIKAKELVKHAYNMSLAEADTFVKELMGR